MPMIHQTLSRTTDPVYKNKLRLGTAPAAIATVCALATAFIAPSQAIAQDTGDEKDTIVVTGSRLIRTDLNAPSPIVNIGENYLDFSGNVTIEETLNEFPQLVAAETSSTNSSGAGVVSANLRDLGATRTLVLVNGKRFTPANTAGIVDLSSIPNSLVERVEIITGGASAVYGSDAVAGAVNFILKDSFEGLELNYQYGNTFEGGGSTQTIEGVYGASTSDGRGNVIVSGSYVDREQLKFSERDFSARSYQQGPVGPDGRATQIATGSSNIPGRRVSTDFNLLDPMSVDLTNTNTDKEFSAIPDGSCGSINAIRFGTGGIPLPNCADEDRYNVNPDNLLLRPLRRWQISGLGSYEITENVEAYAELFFMQNSQSWQQAEFSATFRTPGANALIIPDLANNTALSQATRDFFTANAAIYDPDSDGTYELFGVRGRGKETGPRRFNFDRTTFSMTAGLRGDFNMGDNAWQWDSYFQFQRADQTQVIENTLTQARLAQGLDVVLDPMTMQTVCRSQLNGCVPVNPFGLGSITPEMGEFLTPTKLNSSQFERKVASATVSGTLFDTSDWIDGFGGPVSTAFGVEYRDEFVDIIPSPLDESGPGQTASPRQTGDYDLFELFMETRIPIIEDGIVHSLAIEGAVRYSDYSTIGSAWTWKVGAELAPVEWFRFRGAYSIAIRAPNLGELLAPQSVGFAGYNDPCDINNTPSQAVKDFCVLQGMPAGLINTYQQASQGVDARSGGNPNLNEESSKTYTIGAVVSPPMIPNLNIAVDYFNISVTDAVGTTGVQTVSDLCYASLDQNNPFCQQIGPRLPNGEITEIQTTLLNLGAINVDGLDVSADWSTDLPGSFGIGGNSASLGIRTTLSWMFNNETISITGVSNSCLGVFGPGCSSGPGGRVTPDFRANTSLNFTSGPLNFGVNMRYIAGLNIIPGREGDFFVDTYDSAIYVDLFARYNINEVVEVYGGVDNVGNNQPAALHWGLAGDSNVHPDLYDVLGRRFFVGARVTF